MADRIEPTPPGPPRPTGPSAEPASPVTFQPIARRTAWMWRLQVVIGLTLVGGAALVPTGVALLGGAEIPSALVWAVGPLLATLALLALWWPSPARRAWGHRLDERVLEVRHGVLFRVTQLVPLSRLQHVDLRAGPLERLFGLASLVVYTAGTQQAAITLPGLRPEEAQRLRDVLVEVGGDDGV